MKSLRKIAKDIGLHEVTLYRYLNRHNHASLPTALKIEKATHGKFKVEDLVRPEIAEALREYLRLRCPTLTNLQESTGGERRCQ